MSLKRAHEQTKISDFFGKRFKQDNMSEPQTSKEVSQDSRDKGDVIDSIHKSDVGQFVNKSMADNDCISDSSNDTTLTKEEEMNRADTVATDGQPATLARSQTLELTDDDVSENSEKPLATSGRPTVSAAKDEGRVLTSSQTLDLSDYVSEDSEGAADNVQLKHTISSSSSVSQDMGCSDSSNESIRQVSRGVDKEQLKRLEPDDLDFGLLPNHVDLTDSATLSKKPDKTDDVRMPFYAQGLLGTHSRWDAIKSALAKCNTIRTSKDLEKIIRSYNQTFPAKFVFSGFDQYLERLDSEEKSATLETLTKMAQLALDLKQLCTKPIPILRCQNDQAVTLSQHLIASLLANAFFCTFSQKSDNLPSINFSSLFAGGQRFGRPSRPGVAFNKLRCLFHYFKRVITHTPTGKVTFHRQVLKAVKDSQVPVWKKSETCLTDLHVTSKGSIEDEERMLQVDFANRWVGGGALGSGCVQEEIRFMITPELIVSRLFTEVLEENECVVVTGCETFSTYRGYGSTFEWTGNHEDQTPRDNFGRKLTQVVMIDAICLRNKRDQFSENLVKRELMKAYCGFFCPLRRDGVRLSAVATGNWGCGAFGGDLQLKSIIQLMAAAEAGRDVCYFTFDQLKLVDDLHQIHSLFKEQHVTVGQMYTMIESYFKHFFGSKSRNRKKSLEPLFDYIRKRLQSGHLVSSPERTDDEDYDDYDYY